MTNISNIPYFGPHTWLRVSDGILFVFKKNGCVSNHWHIDSLFNNLFWSATKKSSKFHITPQRTSNAENISMLWCHHAISELDSSELPDEILRRSNYSWWQKLCWVSVLWLPADDYLEEQPHSSFWSTIPKPKLNTGYQYQNQSDPCTQSGGECIIQYILWNSHTVVYCSFYV